MSRLLLLLALAVPCPPQGLDEAVAAIRRGGEESSPEGVEALARFREPGTITCLAELYGEVGSIVMREAVLVALSDLARSDELGASALDAVARIGVTETEKELWERALDVLAGHERGGAWLQGIVESQGPDAAREQSMRRINGLADPDTLPWTRALWEAHLAGAERYSRSPEEGQDADEAPLGGFCLPEVRDLAFARLAPGMEKAELVRAVDHKAVTAQEAPLAPVRRLALLELERRDPELALDAAAEMFDDVEEHPSNRLLAARMLVEQRRAKIVKEFLDVGGKYNTPLELREGLADLLAVQRDDALIKKLIRRVGKGKTYEQRFVLRALTGVRDEKLEKLLGKMLENRERELRLLAARTLAEPGWGGSTEVLRERLEEEEDVEVLAALVEAVSERVGFDEEWEDALRGFAVREEASLRNAALARLGRPGAAENLPVLVAALEAPDWSTRLVALHGLEALRMEEAVGVIVARLPAEEGRMRVEFADALWRLTAQPFRTSATSWTRWWEDEGAGFRLVTPEELASAEAEREERRRRSRASIAEADLEQSTQASFFGFRIVSQRVIFVVDISGSMSEPLRSEDHDARGETRMVAAVRQLDRCIDALTSGSQFNIVTFASGVTWWLDGGVADSLPEAREEAKVWISRLGAGGGTNLHGGLRSAFTDPEVDTIYLLSDGEPSMGEVTDPWALRELVRRWNEHRGVVIHTISLGSTLDVLRGLSVDSGGDHVRIR